MSHIPQRQEKDCLNCGAIVQGRYCQNCGQENVVPKETFWHMVTHFFYDITHFDSSFFHTVHHLLFKPGFLSLEYQKGKRASYLHPVRMYVFTSAIFFLLFFSFFGVESTFKTDVNRPLNAHERAKFKEQLEEEIRKDTSNLVLKQELVKVNDTSKVITQMEWYKMIEEDTGPLKIFGSNTYKSVAEYDSLQRLLPVKEQDGWLSRRFTIKGIAINNKYRHNPQDGLKNMGESILHRLPYMLFVSLPLFALILRLVYIRRRKQFYFADHGVFTIHLYVFSFILLLLLFSLSKLSDATHWKFLGPVMGILFFSLFVYLYIAMKNFYRQGWGKTFLKFLLVAILSLVMMLVLLVFFILFSAFTL